MTKSIADRTSTPAGELDPEVVRFRQQFDERSSLDAVLRRRKTTRQAPTMSALEFRRDRLNANLRRWRCPRTEMYAKIR